MLQLGAKVPQLVTNVVFLIIKLPEPVTMMLDIVVKAPQIVTKVLFPTINELNLIRAAMALALPHLKLPDLATIRSPCK